MDSHSASLLLIGPKSKFQQILSSTEESLTSEAPIITLHDALIDLRQVRVSTATDKRAPVATMKTRNTEVHGGKPESNKRRIEDRKKTSQCYGSGKTGNWVKDQYERLQVVIKCP